MFILMLLSGLTSLTSLMAQESRPARFIGLNPSVTVEPYYEKGELDLNIFPLVYQQSISRRTDFRFISIANYGFRKTQNAFTHLGLQLACPVFLLKKENSSQFSKGFFVAPGTGFTRNLMEKHTNLGFWIEPGYHVLFDDGFSLSFSAQLGATHFWYDDGVSKWGKHFGIKFIFGKWF